MPHKTAHSNILEKGIAAHAKIASGDTLTRKEVEAFKGMVYGAVMGALRKAEKQDLLD